MKLFGPLVRDMTLAGLLAVSALVAAPAQAGKADVALLHSYIGTWKGTGVLTGAESETVRCNLKLSAGNQDKVNYSGRCSIAGGPINITGTLAFIEAKNRYEAVMTSVSSFRGTAVGRKRGNGVVFNLKDVRSRDDDGNEVTITASITLQGDRIKVDMNVVFNETGDSLRASVPFTK